MSHSPALGPLSNRSPQYQNQQSLVIDKNGRLRYAALNRRILALPLEILAEIFEHCLSGDDCSDFISPDPATAPLILCRICRQWREVALSSPKLWSSLHIDLVHLPEDRWDAYVELYLIWLSRARQAPLSLLIEIPQMTNEPESIHTLSQSLIAMSVQCRRIEFDPNVVDIQSLFSNDMLTPPAFPSLETVSCTSITDTPDYNLPFRATNAPRLHEFHCADSYSMNLPKYFPWAQITCFSACGPPRAYFQVLKRAVNLVDAVFQIWDEDVGHFPTSSLSISVVEGDGDTSFVTAMSFLSCLKTPALKHLCLDDTQSSNPHYADMTPFLSWISRSAVQLHSFELSLVQSLSITLIMCLKAVPSLVELSLHIFHSIDWDSVFSQLEDTSFLPNLTSMCCGCWMDPRLSQHVLAKALRWRWDAVGVARLRSFEARGVLFFNTFYPQNAEFVRLREQGMNLSFPDNHL
ncbi:hypothetical protein R3P38DRAFT_2904402 [Favolaschia claudopus]|uniref:F-box domain-containing protein n=1 Tax=Favolaschia claudopus TaxID=2862362 RepID=A0AAW0CIT8_9AGAR